MCLFIFDLIATIYSKLLGVRYTTYYYDGTQKDARVVHVNRAPWPGMAAMTLGNTILYKGARVPNAIIRHEMVHVAQWRRYGCLFPVLYLWASIKSLVKHGNTYWDNDFEVEARRAE